MKKFISVIVASMLICTTISSCGAKTQSGAASTKAADIAVSSQESDKTTSSQESDKTTSSQEADKTKNQTAVRFEPGYFSYSYEDEIEGEKIECTDYLVLMDDGKGFYSAQDTVDLTWNWTDIKRSDGTQMKIVPDGDNLIITEGDLERSFLRTYKDLPADLEAKILDALYSRDYEGVYSAGDDTKNPGEISFTRTEKGYDVALFISGLCEMKGDGNDVDGAVEIGFKDPDGNDMYGIFFPVCDTYTLRITQSKWDKIKDQTDFTGYIK